MSCCCWTDCGQPVVGETAVYAKGCCCAAPNEGPGLPSSACSPVAGVPCGNGNCQNPGVTSNQAVQTQSETKSQIIASDTWGTIKSLSWFGGSATPQDVWSTFSSDVKYYYGQDILIGLVILFLLVFFFIFWTVRLAVEG